ncbi:BZ3500_MvSof-1268-A1-R1_Chr3-3g06468 [Microbotryum saponariae]|uniref:BZ3500_MvSof-1268-A1-R1_Chr3-3g06468 protein n=1 Tax=Microbotryum saponariae TaxID=289078 RepID=A0A2X0L0U8_9BASI|nr:BZ3500_MvSof-1268-A1-R1_Chr3-3g06468 [Microbotryum saponariae]SDA04435.1 BZ3501_MvSof-1269-A2-R1_Chr3-2g06155 [Microbotryum saponariae]
MLPLCYPSSHPDIGPEAVKGQGQIRRYLQTKEALTERPAPHINVVADILASSVKRFGDRPALGWRDLLRMHEEEKEVTKKVGNETVTETKKWSYFELSDYKYMSYNELASKVKAAASALVEAGHSSKTIFNIYASTSVNWQVMANGCASQGITFATAYDSLGEDGLQHSLAEPEVYGLFTNANLVSTVANVISSGKTPSVKVVIYDGKDSDVKTGALDKLEKTGVKVYKFDDFIALGREKPHSPNHPQPEDLACIMYTSGSTGAPKGVLLTNANIIAAIGGAETLLHDLTTPDARYIAFLPLAHIFEMAVEMTLLYVGIPIGYGTVKTLTDTSVRNCAGDIRAFKPTIMCGVPAVWELIRKGIMAKVKAGGGVKQKLFNYAVNAKKAAGPGTLTARIADAVVFKPVKQGTGGALKYIINGGASVSKETQQFLSTALCDTMIQGYGMTETCALSFILPPSLLQSGVVGVPCPSIEAKLVDFEEAGYFSTNSPPQGEVWIRGPTVTKGYFKREDLTKEAITEDGWFQTGDIGQWNPDGTLSIIDRKKNLVKLQGGEYVALERLESIYKSTPCVANIAVHADSNAARPMAIIVLHEGNSKNLAEANGMDGSDLEALASNKDFKKLVVSELAAGAKRANLKSLEQISVVVLTAHEWTPQNGLLTAAQKLQRKGILEKYKDEVSAVYP